MQVLGCANGNLTPSGLDFGEHARVVALKSGGPLKQLDEDSDFLAEDVGVVRLDDVIDRAFSVPSNDVPLFAVNGSEENDWGRARPQPLLHERGGFEAVQPGHLNIKQHAREVLEKHVAQRLFARRGLDQPLVQWLEDGAKRHEVRARVVDEKDVCEASVRGGPRLHRAAPIIRLAGTSRPSRPPATTCARADRHPAQPRRTPEETRACSQASTPPKARRSAPRSPTPTRC